jgi:hypothetical protein
VRHCAIIQHTAPHGLGFSFHGCEWQDEGYEAQKTAYTQAAVSYHCNWGGVFGISPRL